MEDLILRDPISKLKEYTGTVSGGTHGFTPFELGQISIGLRIETDRRILQTCVGNSLLSLSREEICTALDQVMKNSGLYERTQLWYERLLAWDISRRPKFVADASGGVHPVVPVSPPAVLSGIHSPHEGNGQSPALPRTDDPCVSPEEETLSADESMHSS